MVVEHEVDYFVAAGEHWVVAVEHSAADTGAVGYFELAVVADTAEEEHSADSAVGYLELVVVADNAEKQHSADSAVDIEVDFAEVHSVDCIEVSGLDELDYSLRLVAGIEVGFVEERSVVDRLLAGDGCIVVAEEPVDIVVVVVADQSVFH